ncbi:MAG: hypothetical protein ACRDMH_12665 [Solirubrobacterales bacterium]
MTTQSDGMRAHWQDPEVRKRRRAGANRRREVRYLERVIAFSTRDGIVEMTPQDEARLAEARARLAELTS